MKFTKKRFRQIVEKHKEYFDALEYYDKNGKFPKKIANRLKKLGLSKLEPPSLHHKK